MLLVSELRLLDVEPLKRRLVQAGWHGFLHPGIPTRPSQLQQTPPPTQQHRRGTLEQTTSEAAGSIPHPLAVSAGVGILWRSQLHISALDESICDLLYSDAEISSRFVCALLRLRGQSVLLVEIYLFVGEELSDRNKRILSIVPTRFA